MSSIDPCESFHLLISAALDGELEEREQRELEHHLAGCPGCQRWRSAAAELDRCLAVVAGPGDDAWVGGPAECCGDEPGRSLNGRPRETWQAEPASLARPSRAGRGGVAWRVWCGGLAALLLVAVGIGLALLARPPEPQPTLSVAPLETMHAINVQSEQDQQTVLETVELDLRTIRLELKQLDLDDAARRELAERIDTLLTKTRQLKPSTPVSYQGDLP